MAAQGQREEMASAAVNRPGHSLVTTRCSNIDDGDGCANL